MLHDVGLSRSELRSWHDGVHRALTNGGTPTPSNGPGVTRNASATFWLPSEDEWYKAAYHDASADTTGTYFNYATGSNSIPISDQPDDNPNAVNYKNDDGLANGFNDGYAVSGSTNFPRNTNPFTDVGAYTAAESSYGTLDQNGNVWEWNEAVLTEPGPGHSGNRGMRGASYAFDSFVLSAGFRAAQLPFLRVPCHRFSCRNKNPRAKFAAAGSVGCRGSVREEETLRGGFKITLSRISI